MLNHPTMPEISDQASVLPVVGEYIGIKAGFCGGKPHVLGHRIKVQHIVVWHERMSMSAEEIVATYPTLSLSAVYAALAYYHGRRAEIDADIDSDERVVDELKAKAGLSKIQMKLAELHAQNASLPPG